MKKYIIALITIVLIVGSVVLTKYFNTQSEEVSCTMEAKQCPDGSYVGRTGPKCEFSDCPVLPETLVNLCRQKTPHILNKCGSNYRDDMPFSGTSIFNIYDSQGELVGSCAKISTSSPMKDSEICKQLADCSNINLCSN